MTQTTPTLNRRTLFAGMAAALAAPAIAKADALMRISPPFVWGDGLHDDTQAIQAMIDRAARTPGVREVTMPANTRLWLPGGLYIPPEVGVVKGSIDRGTVVVSRDERPALKIYPSPRPPGSLRIIEFHVRGSVNTSSALHLA